MGLISATLEIVGTLASKARHAGEAAANATSAPGGPGGPLTGAGGGGSGFGNGGSGGPPGPRPDYQQWFDQIWEFLKNVNEPFGWEAARQRFGWKKAPGVPMPIDIAIKVAEVTPATYDAYSKAEQYEDLLESTTERSEDPLASRTEAYEKQVAERSRKAREAYLKQQAKKGGAQ